MICRQSIGKADLRCSEHTEKGVFAGWGGVGCSWALSSISWEDPCQAQRCRQAGHMESGRPTGKPDCSAGDVLWSDIWCNSQVISSKASKHFKIRSGILDQLLYLSRRTDKRSWWWHLNYYSQSPVVIGPDSMPWKADICSRPVSHDGHIPGIGIHLVKCPSPVWPLL